MNTIPIKLLLLLLFASAVRGGEITVLLNPKSTNVRDALIVVFPPKVAVIKGQSTLNYRILNRSSKDIFVVIKSRNVDGWHHLMGRGKHMAGGGTWRGLEGAFESLRLLYAPRRSTDGEIEEGEDGLLAETDAEVIVSSGRRGSDLSEWTGGSGVLELEIRYYVSDSKYRRQETLAVPLEIQAAELPGADRPTTKPADKLPAEGQPPSPTSKDAPR